MSDTPVTKGTTALEFHVFDIKRAIIQLGPAGFCKHLKEEFNLKIISLYNYVFCYLSENVAQKVNCAAPTSTDAAAVDTKGTVHMTKAQHEPHEVFMIRRVSGAWERMCRDMMNASRVKELLLHHTE